MLQQEAFPTGTVQQSMRMILMLQQEMTLKMRMEQPLMQKTSLLQQETIYP